MFIWNIGLLPSDYKYYVPDDRILHRHPWLNVKSNMRYQFFYVFSNIIMAYCSWWDYQSTFFSCTHVPKELGYCSQYSNWLQAGQQRGWSSSPCRVKNVFLSISSRSALGSTPIQWVLGAVSRAVKWPGREADHAPPSSAEVKKMCICTSTLHTPSWHSA
jgi:hypothetical protein